MENDTDKTIGQLHEDERLTDNLTDESAKLLLDWAESWIKKNNQSGAMKNLVPVSDGKILELVRAINRLSGSQSQMNEVEFLQGLLNLLNIVLNSSNNAQP